MKTQGRLGNGDTPTGLGSPRRPRRSVIAGSVVSLVVGVVLASTALPAFARTLAAAPSTTLTQVSTTILTTSTTSPTTTVATRAHRRAGDRISALTTTATTPGTRSHDSSPSTPTTTPDVTPTTTPTATPTTTPTTTPTPSTTTPAPTTTTPPTTTVPKPVQKSAPAVALRLGANIAPDPNFLSSGTGQVINGALVYENPCVTAQATWPNFTNAADCTNYVLEAINNARAQEGVKPMVLPSNWFSLSTAQQLFVVADLERVDRGLPPYLGLNAALSSAAQHAAATKGDPSIAAGFPIGTDAQGDPAFGGAWAGGYSVLVADYVWMYDDGWGGASHTSNVACTSAGSAGCWAHRDELLGSDPGYNPGVGLMCDNCEMGTGFAMVGGTSASFVDLIEMPKSGQPAMTFTWADEQSFLG